MLLRALMSGAVILITSACLASGVGTRKNDQRVAEVGGPALAPGLDSTCVVEARSLAMTGMRIDHVTGDTLLGAMPISQLAADTTAYAGQSQWFKVGDVIWFRGNHYEQGEVIAALPDSAVGLLRPAGQHRGITFFALKSDEHKAPEALLVPVKPPCVFVAFIRV